MAYVSERCLDYIADSLETFLSVYQTVLIDITISKNKYDKSVKKLKKLIKKLRKRKIEDIFDEESLEALAEMLEREAERYERMQCEGGH